MKKLVVLLPAIIVFYLASTVSAQPLPKVKSKMNQEVILKSLLEGTQSENKGLCASCVYQMGELRSDHSVIPLLSILHNGKCDEIRIMAALSLYKISDSRGLFAIKQASKFDKSARVRRMCAIFYKAHLTDKQREISVPIEVAENK